MNNTFEKGEELYNRGDFEKSFQVFSSILNDNEATSIEKSDALNMMGVILKAAPSLSTNNEFEESLLYFRKALKLNPNNLGALLNVVEEFGNSFGQHRDLDLFKLAYNKLIELSDELSSSDKKMLKHKYLLYLEHL